MSFSVGVLTVLVYTALALTAIGVLVLLALLVHELMNGDLW